MTDVPVETPQDQPPVAVPVLLEQMVWPAPIPGNAPEVAGSPWLEPLAPETPQTEEVTDA